MPGTSGPAHTGPLVGRFWAPVVAGPYSSMRVPTSIGASWPPGRVIALTDNVPLITAWGNDVSYDTVFTEQLRNLANPGDVLIVITGSGNSPNIVQAVRAARELRVTSIGLLGFDGGSVKTLLDHYV